MALRNVAGGVARLSAGFWTEVAKAMTPPGPTQPNVAEPQRDADAEREASRSATAAASAPTLPAETGPDAAASSPGGVMVPIDTWTRMLDQLGNLHEAGRDLAEARERAARAETQAEFLREQLADAKAKAKAKRKPPAQEPPVLARPAQAPDPTQVIDLRSGTRTRVASARDRVGRWISTS